MALYVEYTTVTDVRNRLVGDTATGQDNLYLDLIRSTSREIDRLATRRFVPTVQTVLFDTPGYGYSEDGHLNLGDLDLLEVTTLLNGDGSTITSTQYVIYPANHYPKRKIELKLSSGIVWLLSNAGDYNQAISLTGVFGHHQDYTNAWNSVDTLNGAISSSATSLTLNISGSLRGGDLIKIDSEFIYTSSVSGVTATVVRSVNGSTAAAHSNAASISVWQQFELEMVCRVGVLAYERLKNNPVGETINVGGYSFTTPKDVTQYIKSRLDEIGFTRIR